MQASSGSMHSMHHAVQATATARCTLPELACPVPNNPSSQRALTRRYFSSPGLSITLLQASEAQGRAVRTSGKNVPEIDAPERRSAAAWWSAADRQHAPRVSCTQVLGNQASPHKC